MIWSRRSRTGPSALVFPLLDLWLRVRVGGLGFKNGLDPTKNIRL